MNKIFSVLLLVTFSFGIISCSNEDSSGATSQLGQVLDQPNSTDDENKIILPVVTASICELIDNSVIDNSTVDKSSISDNSSIKNSTVNILTHCNAGWLATVDWGTALSPIFKANKKNIPIHVWVDETRPRNQGFNLTAWELINENIPNSLIVDNVGGHLMQKGMVDVCITGTDRTTLNGDVCNKIGTYLKALAAFDNKIPFYVAAPISSIDFTIQDGINNIPIEERDEEEVSSIYGINSKGITESVKITPKNANCKNYAFDVTPAKFITKIITERKVVDANQSSISELVV